MIHQLLQGLHQAEWDLPDPGTGNAIPFTRWGMYNLVTAAAGETNTLANPVKAGCLIGFNHVATTGGGTRIITVAASINEAANTTITLTHAREAIWLISVAIAAGAFRWQVLVNQGTTLG